MDGSGPSSRLAADIANGQVVVVAGAGVGIAASNAAPSSSWLQLVQSGIDFVRTHETGNEGWLTIVQSQIDAAKSSEPDQLLQAASQVSQRIRRIGDQAYASWLESTVGALEAEDPSWISAISSLGVPIFTTNYDHLFETVTGHAGADWTDQVAMQRILNRGGGIGHLHGRVEKPESVIFSEADYQRLRGHEAAQAIERAIATSRSILYIGCGDTLTDPNFSALLDWHRSLFPVSGAHHYRLCREHEVAELTVVHANDDIEVVPFGVDYSDLPGFLSDITPRRTLVRSEAGVIRDPVSEAREYLLNQIRDETIVGEGRLDRIDASLESLVVAPVLLPIPQSEFFKARKPDDERPPRVDPIELLQGDPVVLVVAEQGGGLSTALKWLLQKAAEVAPRSAPLYLDYRTFPSGVNSLLNAAKLEASGRGLITSRRDSLPEVAVAIDNFVGSAQKSARVVDDLKQLGGIRIVGVVASAESDTLERMQGAGISPRIAYLGKMGAAEVKEMAKLASPSYAQLLASGVMATLQTEHLPRTPFNIALLIAILLRGESLIANASPTLVLDQYVSHLLGRDETDTDPYFSLTSTDRESILTDLAAMFVEGDQGSVQQSDAVLRMERFFERFAWKESPAEVLADLVTRRVLLFEGSQLRFTQSSFLHLFAAKAAAKHGEQRDRLLERPLYFNQVLRAYASLVRHDEKLLTALQGLIVEKQMNLDSRAYSRVEPVQASPELEHQLRNSVPDGVDPESLANDELDHPFDLSEDKDILPFPSTSEDDLSALARSVQSVDLVSAALRDSEEVEDLELKRTTLLKSLRGWGQVLEDMSDDEGFQDLVSRMRQSALEMVETSEPSPALQEFVDTISQLMPAIFVSMAIESSLTSRKLILLLQKLVADGQVQDDPRVAIPAAILIYSIQERDWFEDFRRSIEKHRELWTVQRVLFQLIENAFFESKPGSVGEGQLRDAVVDNYANGLKFNNQQQRKAIESARRTQIDKAKALYQRSRAAAAKPAEEE